MATSGKDARADREAKLDALHDRLTGAVEQLVSGEDWARALAFAARSRARSFANTILIFTQHQEAYGLGLVPDPVPSHVAGYRQWQQLGRQVSKGQPGYQILAPVTGRFASATPQDAESWRSLGKGEKPRAGETVRTKMVGVRAEVRTGLDQLTELLVDLDELYNKCEPAERRFLNRALFTRITTDDEENATYSRPPPASSHTSIEAPAHVTSETKLPRH